MATLHIVAKINLNALVKSAKLIPAMLDMEPKFDLVGDLDGVQITFNTTEEAIQLVRETIKKEKQDAKRSPLVEGS